MAETISLDKLYRELVALRNEVAHIKESMPLFDIEMTPNEEEKLTKSIENHKKGKSVNLDDFKKELGE